MRERMGGREGRVHETPGTCLWVARHSLLLWDERAGCCRLVCCGVARIGQL